MTLLAGEITSTRGPTTRLPCSAGLARVVAPAWPLLTETGGRARLLRHLFDALMIEDEAASRWATPDAGQSPALFLAEVIARLALHLQTVAGHPVAQWSALPEPDNECCTAAWEYMLPNTGVIAGRVAAAMAVATAGPEGKADRPLNEDQTYKMVTRVSSSLGNTVVEVLLAGAHRRGLARRTIDPVFPMLAFGQGSATRRLMTSIPHDQGHISSLLTRDKTLSLHLLREAGYPVPSHHRVKSEKEAVAAAQSLGYPVVVKPTNLMQSQGVSVNLTSDKTVRQAYREARALSSSIIVEQHLQGLPFRILVIDGRGVAAMRRSVPIVHGDGRSSIPTLIEKTNAARRKLAIRTSWGPRKIDISKFEEELLPCLAAQQLTLESVPTAGREVQLAFIARSGRGGENLDVTAQVHPDNIAMAEEVARIFDVSVFGLDFMTEDIARSFKEGNCGINEVNNEPALSLHLVATTTARDVVTPYLDLVFGPDGRGRVPILCRLEEDDDEAESLLETALASQDVQSGLATGDNTARVGRFHLPAAPRLQRPAQRILADQRVDCAVIALAKGDFVQGLAFDHCTLFHLPRPGSGNADEILVDRCKLMAEHIAACLTIEEDHYDFWSRHLNFADKRTFLLSEGGEASAPSSSGVLPNNLERLHLRQGGIVEIFHCKETQETRLMTFAPDLLRALPAGRTLLRIVASLLALEWPAQEIIQALSRLPQVGAAESGNRSPGRMAP